MSDDYNINGYIIEVLRQNIYIDGVCALIYDKEEKGIKVNKK